MKQKEEEEDEEEEHRAWINICERNGVIGFTPLAQWRAQREQATPAQRENSMTTDIFLSLQDYFSILERSDVIEHKCRNCSEIFLASKTSVRIWCQTCLDQKTPF